MLDSQLLGDYVADHSEKAFRTLVSRYINLVHSTALRQVGNPDLAEEIAQAVFILLARKAPALAQKQELLLGGWLYRTTCFVAARALRGENRRQRREQEAFEMQAQQSTSDDTWRRIVPLLDEGIGRLDQRGRDAVILRFMQNQSLAEVGRTLGVSEDAARKRVNSAVDKLRSFFGRRGFTLSAAVLAGALAGNCATAAPAGMAVSVGSQVLAKAASASPLLPTLVIETLSAWRVATIRTAVAICAAGVVVALLTIHGVNLTSASPANSAPTTKSTANLPTPAAAPAMAAPAMVANSANTNLTAAAHMVLSVVDRATGNGAAGATVVVISAGDMKQVTSKPQNLDIQSNLVTDSAGRCTISFPYAKPLMIGVGVRANAYEERCFVWAGVLKSPDEPPPASYEMKLLPGSRIGGVVRDETGNPVAGAALEIMFAETGDSTDKEFQQERAGMLGEEFSPLLTDAFGRWSFASAPATNGDFSIQVQHPGFPTVLFDTDAYGGRRGRTNQVKLDDLHAGTAVLTLSVGVRLRGTVTDEAGAAIADATVNSAEFVPNSDSETHTGPDGAFTLSRIKPGAGHLTVCADGFAPRRIEMTFSNDPPPVAVQLKPGAQLRLLVVDTNGFPISQARVGAENWMGPGTLDYQGLSDETGMIAWNSAPPDQITLSVLKEGYLSAREVPVIADGEIHKIVLRPEVVIAGSVIDATTKLPLTSFRVYPGPDRSQTVHGTNGDFKLAIHEPNAAIQIHAEADDYEPAIWTPEPAADGNRAPGIVIALKPLDASSGIHGLALLPDGSPASGITVALRSTDRRVELGRGKITGPDNRKTVLTDDAGHFAFSPEPQVRSVVAICPLGFASVPRDKNGSALTMQLQPWGRIEGVIKLRSGADAGRDVMIFDSGGPESAGLDFDLAAYTAKSDENGNFVFEQVPAGYFRLAIMEGIGKVNSHETPVQVIPGATIHPQIGGTGSLITGRFAASGQSAIDWSKRLLIPAVRTRIPYPDGLEGMERARWFVNFRQTDEGRAFLQSMRTFPLQVSPDGSFLVEDVPAGHYEITGQLSDSDVNIGRGRMGHTIGSFRQDIDVSGENSAAIDTGTITVQLNKR